MARGETDAPVQCPYCRQEFAPKDRLRREFSNTWDVKKHIQSNKGIYNVLIKDYFFDWLKSKLTNQIALLKMNQL